MSRYEIMADASSGLWSVPIADAKWTTERGGKAGQLSFSYPRDCGVTLEEGAHVQLRIDGTPVCAAYTFTIDSTRDDLIKITAYDQIRYLQANYTYAFEKRTLDQIVAMLANDFGLQVGALTSTGCPLDLVFEDKKLIDMIEEARALTMDKTGNIYQLWDDNGNLTLSKLPDDRMTNLVVGDGSLLTDYQYKRSIDDDTYNRVTMIQKDKKTGKFTIIHENGDANIQKWGTLQYFEVADEKSTVAEMRAKAQAILSVRNRVKRTLELESLGDLRCAAGASIYVSIQQAGLQGWSLINRATHTFQGRSNHTMKLEMNMIDV